jgi:anaerobic carbon-monoxide dehydrogenase catalytic subunit
MACQDPELIEYAKTKGATGINLAGICCTANETLMRQGVPRRPATSCSQELAIATGAVEAMVVDVQCIMQALPSRGRQLPHQAHHHLAQGQDQGACTCSSTSTCMEIAKEIVRLAIDNYPNRGEDRIRLYHVSAAGAGFSHEYLRYMQGGSYRGSFRPLNDAIMSGRIRGVAGVVGCNNARSPTTRSTTCRLSSSRTTCWWSRPAAGHSAGKFGLAGPEAAMSMAGPGLREVCEAIGIPPVLHLGSCVDNTRILTVADPDGHRGRPGQTTSATCRPWAWPRVDEREGAVHRHLLCGFGRVCHLWHQEPGRRQRRGPASSSVKAGSRQSRRQAGVHPEPEEMVRKALEHIDRKRAELGLPSTIRTASARAGTFHWRRSLPSRRKNAICTRLPQRPHRRHPAA